ncbi:MAG: hypothetical protein LBU14_06215 [Candidatus Peribacteria bacterium]|jgi:hypothetical protein|nr:hypothetical protein [Candidatus Peribacteria bacterium]
MAEYLQNLYNIDKKIINELFAYKSDINTDLKENLLSDMKVVEFNF